MKTFRLNHNDAAVIFRADGRTVIANGDLDEIIHEGDPFHRAMLTCALMDPDDPDMIDARERCNAWLDEHGPKRIVRQ